jgi:cytochrome c556
MQRRKRDRREAMNRFLKLGLASTALAALLGAGLTTGVKAEDKGAPATADKPAVVVKYRENVMKAMGGHMGDLSAIVKGDVSYKDHVAMHAEGIAALARLIPSIFPQGTGPDKVKTETKAEVWRDWSRFTASAKALEDESNKLASLAKAGNMDAVKAQFQNVGKTCGGCHDSFRVKD